MGATCLLRGGRVCNVRDRRPVDTMPDPRRQQLGPLPHLRVGFVPDKLPHACRGRQAHAQALFLAVGLVRVRAHHRHVGGRYSDLAFEDTCHAVAPLVVSEGAAYALRRIVGENEPPKLQRRVDLCVARRA